MRSREQIEASIRTLNVKLSETTSQCELLKERKVELETVAMKLEREQTAFVPSGNLPASSISVYSRIIESNRQTIAYLQAAISESEENIVLYKKSIKDEREQLIALRLQVVTATVLPSMAGLNLHSESKSVQGPKRKEEGLPQTIADK